MVSSAVILVSILFLTPGGENCGVETPEILAGQFAEAVETQDEDLLADLVHPDYGLEIGGGVNFSGFHLEVDEIRTLGDGKYYACFAPGATDVTIYVGQLGWFLFQGWPEDWMFSENIVPANEESGEKIDIVINYDLGDYTAGSSFLAPFAHAGNAEMVTSIIPGAVQEKICTGSSSDLDSVIPGLSSEFVLIAPQPWLEEMGYTESNPEHVVLMNNRVDWSVKYAIFVRLDNRWYLRFAGEAVPEPVGF